MSAEPWHALDGHDAYTLLDVAENASLAEIARAHRRHMKVWHTDANAGPDAGPMSRYLNVARAVLEFHREAYDAHRQTSAATGPLGACSYSAAVSAWG